MCLFSRNSLIFSEIRLIRLNIDGVKFSISIRDNLRTRFCIFLLGTRCSKDTGTGTGSQILSLFEGRLINLFLGQAMHVPKKFPTSRKINLQNLKKSQKSRHNPKNLKNPNKIPKIFRALFGK